MSLSQFKTTAGRVFYYDNELHALLDDERNMLSLPAQRDSSWYTDQAQGEGVRWKSATPKALRISLGQACNYSCTYCMQKDIGNLGEKPLGVHVTEFLDNLDLNLDYSNLTRVELWGGEPFLYWADMVEIMTRLDGKDREFFISTNGSALMHKHLDFFDSLAARVSISISHDGPAQLVTRGEDPLERARVVEVIKRMYTMRPKIGFSFNTVISADNYDLFAINNWFKAFGDANDMPDLRLVYIHATNYDATNTVNSANSVLRGDKLQEFDGIMTRYLSDYTDQLLDPTKPRKLLTQGIVEGQLGVLDFFRLLKYQLPITTHSRCGADSSSVLSVDTRGNALLCPHTSERYHSGTIMNIKGIRVLDTDLDRKKTHCSPCPVKRLCKSSCPIKFPTETFLTNCAVEKVWYGNIQKSAFRLLLGESVELVSVEK